MLTFGSIKEERPEMATEDIKAFLRLCKGFDCLDSDSFEEAAQRMMASTTIATNQCAMAANEDEEADIIRKSLKGFHNI